VSASTSGNILIADATAAGAALKGGAQLGQSSGGLMDLFKTDGFGGDFSFGSFFANGGAFGQGVQMFASGDVFSSPTAFGFGGGRMGVMGEAGPEAVMPLTRLPGGKLGVQANGNGSSTFAPTVQINVAGDATEATIEAMRGMVQQEIAAAAPSQTRQSVNAVRKEHRDNPNYLKR
jgi:lambda family phage tail tape measure protein